jgi:hypothetical protein
VKGDERRAADFGDPFVDLAPLAALGILDADEGDAFEAHARACPACRDERHAYERVAGWLPLALAPERPPLGLRALVLARTARPANDSGSRRLPRPPAPWPARLAGVAAVLLGASLLVVIIQRDAARHAARQADAREAHARQVTDAERERAGALRAALRLATERLERERELRLLLSHGDARVARLDGLAPAPDALARVVWSPRRREALLLVDGLAPAPHGHAYEAWVLDAAGRPVPAGAFQVEADGRALLRLAALTDPARVRKLAVTLEATAGQPLPRGPLVLAGSL